MESPAGNRMSYARYPLTLVTAKSVHFLNICYSNMEQHYRSEESCVCEIFPEGTDAPARHISDGNRVVFFNDRGNGSSRQRYTFRHTHVRPSVRRP